MKRRGLTLVELLTVLTISGILVVGLSTAISTAVLFSVQSPVALQEMERQSRFEDQVRALLGRAYVSSDQEDRLTYFLAGTNTQGSGGLGNVQAADIVTFTALGSRAEASYLMATEPDLESLNQRYGPEGGVVEYSIATVPVGDAPEGVGVFVREQRPADGDPTQGGLERLLTDQVETIGFEFFDGVSWVTQWDTSVGQRRLPSAIRVSYQFVDDEAPRSFLVQLGHSDVTPDDPYSAEATTTTTTGGGEQ